jgi:hypothetical protein
MGLTAVAETTVDRAQAAVAVGLPRSLRLFLLSFLMLFLELALIRWTGSKILYLSYFSNFVLLASFLGIGAGFLRARASGNLFQLAPLLLAILVAFVLVFPVQIERSGDELIFFGALQQNRSGLPIWVTLPAVFVAVAAVMLTVGEGVARAFVEFEPLRAYRLDILGSIAGIVAFSLLSFAGVPPVGWAVIVGVLLVLLLAPALRRFQLVSVAVLVLMLGLESALPLESWSPYYRITLSPQLSGAVQISVNGIPHQTIESVAEACHEWERRRIDLDYEIDGLVIKVDSLDQQRRLGALHDRPRWARAFKWAPMTAQTKLHKIHIRVGRTGALNPWAQLEPVEVGGVTVSTATLHNEDDINRKDIREGDNVIVQRAGDVIPQVVGPVLPHQKGTKPFKMPAKCPLCGVEIVKPEGEAMHRCPNRACPSRGLESLINWVQAAADIEGVGEQLVRRLWDLGLVRSIPELYRLTKEQLLELDGFQEKSASNAVASIEASKQVPFHRVLFGLNIPDVGWVTAQTLARHFGSADALAKATQEDIQEIDGMGPLRAESIAEWFAEEENLRLVEELRMLGLRLESGDELKPVEGPLSGKAYVITGTLERWSRDEAKTLLQEKGAKVSESVSGKTTGVVVGEEPGKSKLTKAQKADVPLLTEADLAQLLGG